ncbi:MAG TPA: DMT family transporter [Aquabacterium sp.]|nr:DMT family transporter [Aquabacterium sp.]HRH30008.1 DMT family transporter [Aquabacterium sp.]
MRSADRLTLLLLAAVWGASFLFLRIAAPAVGPIALAALRGVGAALTLLPLVIWHGQLRALGAVWPTVLVSSLLSCVLPFIGLSWAAQSLPAGPLSVLNATTPMWGALVGWVWSREPLGVKRLSGLMLGTIGVIWLAEDRSGLGSALPPAAIAAALASTLMYAVAVHHSKKYLSGLPPLAVSAGLLSTTAAILIGPALWLGPQPAPGLDSTVREWADVPTSAWAALAGLATICTGVAYALFYRLIDRIGASRALNVAFLIPPFGMLWGFLWLDEPISVTMLISTAVILLGTLLSTSGQPASNHSPPPITEPGPLPLQPPIKP